MSKFTDFYLKADTEQQALEAANVPEYDLVIEDEDGNLRWNTSPSGGAGAFAVTRGPIVGYEEGEEGEQIPIYADGFYGLFRVRTTVASSIKALFTQQGVQELSISQAPARFSGTADPDLININTATKDALRSLNGVDAVRAQAIIDGRPWSSVEDLATIQGISADMIAGWNIEV